LVHRVLVNTGDTTVIKRNPIFLSNLIPKIDIFYFSYYLPNLYKIQ